MNKFDSEKETDKEINKRPRLQFLLTLLKALNFSLSV